ERRPRLLDRSRPRWRFFQLVIGALVTADLVAQEEIEDFHRFLEAVHPLPGWREVDAEGRVLGLIPAGAEAHVEATIGDVVHSDCFSGEQRRMTEGVAAHQ